MKSPFAAALLVTLAPGLSAAQDKNPPAPKDQPATTQPAPQQPTPKQPAPKRRLQLPIQRAKLDNGLRVIMSPDRSSPTVAICVTYDVGSRNEVIGRSGFAHLFEHMMFQGSRNLEKGDHFKLISARGGTLNGTTSTDRTNYFEVLPSSALALGLWLEADRMKTLAVTRENFENQRKVVQEEYRMRISNSAYTEGLMKLNEVAYHGYFPYSHKTIGSMEDLDEAKLEWLQEFHSNYYAPNNAVLAIVGDFEPDQAMQLVHEYFDDARAVDVPPYNPPELKEQTQARELTVIDKNAKTPGFHYGWVIPPFREKNHYALELAAMVLADGESSRLHQLLVRDKELARSVAAWTYDRRGPDLFTVRVLLTERADVMQARQLVDAEIEKLTKTAPSTEELEKARTRLISYFLFGLESTQARARKLAEYELFWNEARWLNEELENYLSISAEDIRSAAAQYLLPARRTAVISMPDASNTSAPADSHASSKEAR